MSASLWHLIRNGEDISTIEENISKLSTDNAVRVAVLNRRFDVANLLLSHGVPYDVKKLMFTSIQSVMWAKEHNIDITLNQISYYTFYLDMLETIHSNYPSLIPLIDATQCTDDCTEYLISKCNIQVTSSMIECILENGRYSSFILIANNINMRDYLAQIARSSTDIIDYVTETYNIHIAEFGINLFMGLDTYEKLKCYTEALDTLSKVELNNLLQLYIKERYQPSALYLVERYDLCMNGLSPMNTAKSIINDAYDELIEEEVGDEYTIRMHKAQIYEQSYNSVSELIADFNSRKY